MQRMQHASDAVELRYYNGVMAIDSTARRRRNRHSTLLILPAVLLSACTSESQAVDPGKSDTAGTPADGVSGNTSAASGGDASGGHGGFVGTAGAATAGMGGSVASTQGGASGNDNMDMDDGDQAGMPGDGDSGGRPSDDGQEAPDLLAGAKLGWNLGNSLDVPEGEEEWGNPPVSRALIQAVANAGFGLVRVPVTWTQFTGPGPDFTIDGARLSRVAEVVQYVLDEGLYAIINIHHDGADGLQGVEWLTLNDADGAITEANNTAVEARFVRIWTQLAEHFRDFDDKLLFESMNEIHDGYDKPDPAYYGIINNLNQVFVDIVRNSGGGNATRKLVVPGYNTNIDYTLEGFVLPQDTIADRLILSVHYYDPWSFAGEGSTSAWGNGAEGADDWGQEDHVVAQFDRLESEYISQGLPMIFGEYGAVNAAGGASYRRYYMEYVTQAACQRGIVPVYWDNGGVGTGQENFGLFDRSNNQVVFPEILDAMVRGCTSDQPLDSIAKP